MKTQEKTLALLLRMIFNIRIITAYKLRKQCISKQRGSSHFSTLGNSAFQITFQHVKMKT